MTYFKGLDLFRSTYFSSRAQNKAGNSKIKQKYFYDYYDKRPWPGGQNSSKEICILQSFPFCGKEVIDPYQSSQQIIRYERIMKTIMCVISQ